jgi:hypothetical protein
MPRRIARLLVLAGMAAATGCVSGSGLPKRVPGSNITLPERGDIVRDFLLGCEASRDTLVTGRNANCDSVIGGTRAVPAAPVSPP